MRLGKLLTSLLGISISLALSIDDAGRRQSHYPDNRLDNRGPGPSDMGPDIRGVPQNEVVEWGASLWYSTTDDILRIHLLGPMTVSTKEAELLDGNERRKRALVVAYYSNLFTTWLDRDHEFEFDASSYEFLFGKENGQYPGYGGVVGVRITTKSEFDKSRHDEYVDLIMRYFELVRPLLPHKKLRVPDAFSHDEIIDTKAQPPPQQVQDLPSPPLVENPYKLVGFRLWHSYAPEKRTFRAHLVGGMRVTDAALVRKLEGEAGGGNRGARLAAVFFAHMRAACRSLQRKEVRIRHVFSAENHGKGAEDEQREGDGGAEYLGAMGFFVESEGSPDDKSAYLSFLNDVDRYLGSVYGATKYEVMEVPDAFNHPQMPPPPPPAEEDRDKVDCERPLVVDLRQFLVSDLVTIRELKRAKMPCSLWD